MSGIWENASLDEGDTDDTFGEEGRAVSADVGDVVEHALSSATAAKQMATEGVTIGASAREHGSRMTGVSDDRLIVALGGGSFQFPPNNGALDTFLLALARDHSGRDRPRICYVPTASADSDTTLADFYAAFSRRAEPSHLALFDRTVDDLDALLRAQDIVFIAGGNTANMLALWRLHGVDRALLAAWEAGVVMSGVSAGGICWFEGFTTDSFGPELRAVRDGFGVLRGSFIPHYHGESQRRPLFHRLVADGTLPGGYGVDDGAALVFHGTELSEAVTSLPDATAYRVDALDGQIREQRLGARRLDV